MKKYRIEKTCGACPEQYDVYIDDKKLGYLRLRHGVFRVEYMGEVIYVAHPNGDGMFEDDEREKYLKKAKKKLLKRHKHENS